MTRKNDPKVESAEVLPPQAASESAARAGDDDDVPNREFAEQVRKALNVGTNAAALEQLKPYLSALAKPE